MFFLSCSEENSTGPSGNTELSLDVDINQAILGNWILQIELSGLIGEDFAGLESWETIFENTGTYLDIVKIFGFSATLESTWELNENLITVTRLGESSSFYVIVTADSLVLVGDEGSTLKYLRKTDWSSIILGDWKIEDQLVWTFINDGTLVHNGDEASNLTWKREGNRLTITNVDTDEVFSKYAIKSLSNSEMVIVDIEYPDYENKYYR